MPRATAHGGQFRTVTLRAFLREELRRRLRVDDAELESFVNAMGSEIDLSVGALLKERGGRMNGMFTASAKGFLVRRVGE